MMQDQVLTFLNKTGLSLTLADVAVAKDHRKLPNGKYKSSYHVMIPSVCIKAAHMNASYDALNLPSSSDRAPFNISPTGRRLWRVIGASKKGSLTFFKPTFISPHAHPLPFHNYFLT